MSKNDNKHLAKFLGVFMMVYLIILPFVITFLVNKLSYVSGYEYLLVIYSLLLTVLLFVSYAICIFNFYVLPLIMKKETNEMLDEVSE